MHLMLLRHAKSSWNGPALDDRDRPLTARGKSAAQAMGRAMRSRKLVPDLVLCSPARRARDTWDLVSEQLKTGPRMVVQEDIYDFGNGGKLAGAIREHGGEAKTLLLVGHNPSTERLAARLATAGDRKLRDRLAKKYPTGALTVFESSATAWADFDEAGWTLTHFIRPKDILADDH